MRLLQLLLIGFTTLVFTRTAQAQGYMDGFMRGARNASLGISASQETYDTYFINKTETRNPNLGTVTTQALTVMGTYGLGYDLDLIVTAPYVRSEASAGYWAKQEGFQDVTAALRWEAYDYKFGKTRLSWLFGLGYSIPMQNYVNDAMVAIGKGSRNLDGRTILHFKAPNFFITGQYGYIRRGQVSLDRPVNFYDPGQLLPYGGSKVNVPDVTELIVQAGIVTKIFNINVWGHRQTPYNKGTDIGPSIPFPTNAVGFTRVGATAYLRLLKQLGVTATYGTTIDGRNIGKSTQLNAGLVIGYWNNNR
ncbi:hypothetical protein GCM10028807_02700 [Spirosoma daeguense]